MSDSIFRIWSIALYEAKVIMRGWLYRIALLVNLAALIGLYFMRSFSFRFFYAGFSEIPSSFPKISFLFSNGLIALAGAIIAAESYFRLRTYDSNEAVLSRDFCLLEFAVGRAAGLLFTFVLHVGLVCAVTLVYNLIFANAETSFQAYLLYPLLICLPSYVFFTGLAALVQAAAGNRALTMTAILGAAALFILFSADRFFHTFDVFAIRIPMLLSLYTGLEGASNILAQRAVWLLTGAAMSGAALLMLRRPRQSRVVSAGMTVSVPLVIVVSAILLGSYVNTFTAGIGLRAGMVKIAGELKNEPLTTPETFVIDLSHDGGEICVSATVALLNDRLGAIGKYIFNLNPGLEVFSVESGGRPLDYTRMLQVIEIEPAGELQPGERDTIRISCRGTIDDRACFPDADESVRWRGISIWEKYYEDHEKFAFRYSHFRFNPRHSWINPDYVLLPPHSMWYPAPGVMRGSQDPALEHRFFAEHKVSVTTRDGLKAVSQGPAEMVSPGRFMIVSDEKLPGMTVAIGRYSNRSIEVDGIDYSLSTLCSDDYFLPHCVDLVDTLPSLIRELKDWIELTVGMDYPLDRIALVEVPAGFNSIPRPLVTNGLEYSQPGMILAPERGYGWDIGMLQGRHLEIWRLGWDKRDPKVILASCFIGMLRHTMLVSRFYFPISSWYSGLFHISSPDCPVLDHAFESYYAEKMNYILDIDSTHDPGTGRLARTIISLDGASLSDLIEDPSRREEAIDALPLKGKQLILEMESFTGERELEEFLAVFIAENRGSSVHAEDFYHAFEEFSGVDIQPLVREWYLGSELPGFFIEDLRWYGKRMDRTERAQVRLTVFNRGNVAGLVRVMVNPVMSQDANGMFRPSTQARNRVFRLEPGEAGDLGVVTDFKPRSIWVNTLISKNLPAVQGKFLKKTDYDYRDDAVLLDGLILLDASLFLDIDPGIVVDNRDPGFEIVSDPESPFLMKVFGDRRRPVSGSTFCKFHPREAPPVWRETVLDVCYGPYVRSGHYIVAGSGSGRVRWTVEIPENGTYDVYHHMADNWGSMKPEHRKNICTQEYHFSISHDDDIDDQVLVMHECPPGWNLLGTYYFTKGKATVELSDESPKLFVIADAVKWVKKD